MFKSEWKNVFKTPKMIASVFAIMIIPIIYTGMFLWAFYNPYANLSSLPVAIVNEDIGAVLDGEEIKLGIELVDNLIENDVFSFTMLSKEDAEEALENREYYMVIEIPENFSQHATTLLDEDPSKLTINYISNEGNNFLGGQITDSAIEKIRIEVNTEVSRTYAEQIFESISTMANGYSEASEGASDIKDGASELLEGSNDLKGYLQQLALSSIELADGTSTLRSGTQEAVLGASDLQGGLQKLEDGSKQLQQGAQSAASGASELQTGITQYTAGVAQVTDGYQTLAEKQEQFTAGVEQLASSSSAITNGSANVAQGASTLQQSLSAFAEQISPLLATLPSEQAAALKGALAELEVGSKSLAEGAASVETGSAQLTAGTNSLVTNAGQLTAGYNQAFEGLNQLNGKGDSLTEGAEQIAAGTATLHEKLGELATGVTSASAGSSSLANGLHEILSGTTRLDEGTTTLASKSGELADGGETLVEGVSKLTDGTLTLADKLGEASDEASGVKATDKTYDMFSKPVEVDKTVVNEVPNYGSGFAPYFISMGLAVGGLLIAQIYLYVTPYSRPKSAFEWLGSKLSILTLISIVQALVVSLVVVYLLKIDVVNMPLFLLFTLLASFTFVVIVQALVTVLGDVGKFVALLLLILQLTTSAGTFPIELIPQQLQVFYGWLPMTYTVEAFRALISTGNTDIVYHNMGIIAMFAVGSLILSYLYFFILVKRRYSKQLETEE